MEGEKSEHINRKEMTQEERWFANYEEVMLFMKKNGRKLSKYNLDERRLFTWLKHQRKVMNAGEMRPERIVQFRRETEGQVPVSRRIGAGY